MNYDFAPLPPVKEPTGAADRPVADVTPDASVTTADVAEVAIAAELKTAAQPGFAGVRAARPKHR